MRKLALLAVIGLILATPLESQAWIFVPDKGDTGWQTYIYEAGPQGFTGTAGFVVSNVIDDSAYSELLLDDLSQGGEADNCGFEMGDYRGYTLLGNSCAEVTTMVTAMSGISYTASTGGYFSHMLGLGSGVSTAAFQNASRQPGTTGSILETSISLPPCGKFTFTWAFLAGDRSPWNDFALFYLKDENGEVVFADGLAQIGSPAASAVVAPMLLLLLEMDS